MKQRPVWPYLISIFFLSFSVIMLNVTLHKTNVANDKLIKGYQEALDLQDRRRDTLMTLAAQNDSIKGSIIAQQVKIIKSYEATTNNCINALKNCNGTLHNKVNESKLILAGRSAY